MGAISDIIFDTAQSRLTGIETPLLEKELDHTVEEYFKRSGAYRQSQKLKLVPGKTNYVVTTPHPTMRIEHILAIGRYGMSQYPTELYFSDALLYSSNSAVFEPPNMLKFKTAPSSEDTIPFDTIITPTKHEAVPDVIMERHREGLTDMLLSRLAAIPQKPWSSPTLVAYHGRLATNAITNARRAAQQSFGGPNWVFPPFA